MLLVSTAIVFLLLRVAPGDPAAVMAGPEATAEQIAAVRHALGLDQPMAVQYWLWLSKVLRGDLGVSILSGHSVVSLLGARIPGTVQLAVAAMILSMLIAFPTGVLAAVRQNRASDWIISTINSVGIAIPGFWVGILGIILFSVILGWLPAGGKGDFSRYPVSAAKSFILPTCTLALVHAAAMSRYIKNAMLEVLHEDYVRTARAKGLTERQILLSHSLRNALISIVPFLGLQFAGMLGGLVVIESVFAWPGLGRLMLDAIGNRDYPVVQGGLLFLVVVSILTNLGTDILHGLLDPRARR
jgi:peptide/nickel transport system permease protein